MRLAIAAGGCDDGTEPRLTVPPGAHAASSRLLEAAGIRNPARAVGLVAAATWASKAWPSFNAGVLARRLSDAGREVLLFVGPGRRARLARWCGVTLEPCANCRRAVWRSWSA